MFDKILKICYNKVEKKLNKKYLCYLFYERNSYNPFEELKKYVIHF